MRTGRLSRIGTFSTDSLRASGAHLQSAADSTNRFVRNPFREPADKTRRDTPMSSGDNLVLYAAVYSDDAAAASDFAALKSADEANDNFRIEGSVTVAKDADGRSM